MLPDVPFLEAYNCDSSSTFPKPSWSERAKKQLYRSDYVLYHHVHYSTVTQGYLDMYQDHVKVNNTSVWKPRYGESPPSERVTDEQYEAVMVHAKETDAKLTRNYRKRCHHEFDSKWRGCYVGYAWPSNSTSPITNDEQDDGGLEVPNLPALYNEDGMEYNCFVNDKVEHYWLPRLQEALFKKRNNLNK
jgi:hypothetical protein